MKITISIFLILAFEGVYSQDTIKIRDIDFLVLNIKKSAPTHIDTIIQDQPGIGLKMTTYLAMIVSGNELMKYENFVNTTIIENGVTRQMTSSNTFYYDQNKLIKVEEFLVEGDNKGRADWYYSEDKPLYYTLKSDKAEDRAALLLTMSKAIIRQVIK